MAKKKKKNLHSFKYTAILWYKRINIIFSIVEVPCLWLQVLEYCVKKSHTQGCAKVLCGIARVDMHNSRRPPSADVL